MKPLILAKSTVTHEQASVKQKLGCDGLELQLLGELIEDRDNGLYKNWEKCFRLDEFTQYRPWVVHMPLVPGMGDVLLESLVDSKDNTLLLEVFRIAQTLGEMQRLPVGVVIHSESFYEKLVDENVWPRIVETVGRLLRNHQSVYLLIENVSPLRGIGKGKTLHLANNYAFDNVEMVKRLREDTGENRVYTCLDTCHAMLAEKYVGALYREVKDRPPLDLSMEAFFRENAPVIGLIHLSTINGSGYGPSRHGVPFTEYSYPQLVTILQLYEKYGYYCPITLEVEESDFSVCEGYRETKMLVDRYFSTQKDDALLIQMSYRNSVPGFAKYADSGLYDAAKLHCLRYGLEAGLDVSQYDNPDLTIEEMQSIYNRLFSARTKQLSVFSITACEEHPCES